MAEPLGEFGHGQPQDDELVKALAKMMGGMLPVVGEAIDAHDFAEAIRNDDKEEMALIGAGAALPFVTPQMLRVAKGIPEAFAQLPDSAFKRLTYELLRRGETTIKDIKDMFNDTGDLVGFHGTKGEVPAFTTAKTDELLGSNTDMWGGPGLYQGHGSLQSPIEIGEVATDGSPIAIHELITPREDITRLAGHNFQSSPLGFSGKVEFGDQSEQVKDALSSLYPDVSDARRQQLYDVSPYATSKPYAVAGIHNVDSMSKPTLASESARNLGEDDIRMNYNQNWEGDMPKIRQQAADAGLAGNIHVEGHEYPRLASVNFDPDRTYVEGVDIAKVDEWNEARGGSYQPAPPGDTFDNMDLTPDPRNPRVRRAPSAKSDQVVWANYEDIFLEPSFMRDDAIDSIAGTGELADVAGAKDLREVDWDEAVNQYMPDDLKEVMAKYNEPGNLKMAMRTHNRDKLEEINTAMQQYAPYPGEGLEELIDLIDEAMKIDPKAAEKLMEIYDVLPEDIPDF